MERHFNANRMRSRPELEKTLADAVTRDAANAGLRLQLEREIAEGDEARARLLEALVDALLTQGLNEETARARAFEVDSGRGLAPTGGLALTDEQLGDSFKGCF